MATKGKKKSRKAVVAAGPRVARAASNPAAKAAKKTPVKAPAKARRKAATPASAKAPPRKAQAVRQPSRSEQSYAIKPKAA
jgi:hypothetical protein